MSSDGGIGTPYATNATRVKSSEPGLASRGYLSIVRPVNYSTAHGQNPSSHDAVANNAVANSVAGFAVRTIRTANGVAHLHVGSSLLLLLLPV